MVSGRVCYAAAHLSKCGGSLSPQRLTPQCPHLQPWPILMLTPTLFLAQTFPAPCHRRSYLCHVVFHPYYCLLHFPITFLSIIILLACGGVSLARAKVSGACTGSSPSRCFIRLNSAMYWLVSFRWSQERNHSVASCFLLCCWLFLVFLLNSVS